MKKAFLHLILSLFSTIVLAQYQSQFIPTDFDAMHNLIKLRQNQIQFENQMIEKAYSNNLQYISDFITDLYNKKAKSEDVILNNNIDVYIKKLKKIAEGSLYDKRAEIMKIKWEFDEDFMDYKKRQKKKRSSGIKSNSTLQSSSEINYSPLYEKGDIVMVKSPSAIIDIPKADGNNIVVVNPSDKIQVISPSTDKFYLVKFNGYTGYLYESWLVDYDKTNITSTMEVKSQPESKNVQTTDKVQHDSKIDRITILYNSAIEELDKGNFQAALDNLDNFIEIDPNYPNSYLLRGYINSTYLNNFNVAFKDFTDCINMNPEDELAYYYRGLAYHRVNKKIEAIKDYTKTISINREQTNAYFMRGLIKSEFNDLNGAIADYDEIIKREKTATPEYYKMSTVYNNKAYCLVRLGKFKEGLPLVNKALQMDESESYIWDTRGEIYYRLELYNNCINDMSRAISIDKEAGNSYYFRGLARIKLGLKNEGCKDLTKAGEQGISEAYTAISENCN